jgi:hypothetical protein
MADLIWTDGQTYSVPDDKVQQAMKDGFRQPSPEEVARKQAGEQTGRAFVEGTLRGATMGVSDPFLAVYTGDRKGMKYRKEESPVAAGFGEVTGAVGTAVATGGGASALVGGGIKGAAFEGGLYGMGSMVSESALDNTPLTTERLAAGMVGGALASGGVAAGMGLVSKGASLGLSKFGGKGLKEVATSTADDIEWRTLTKGMPKGWLERNEPYKPEILRIAKEKGVFGNWSAAIDDATAAKAAAAKQEIGQVVGQELRDLEGFVPLKGDKQLRGELADFMEKRLGKYKDSPAYDEAVKSMGKYVESVRSVDRDWSSLWGDVQSTLFKEKISDNASGEVREEVRKAIRDFVYDEVASGKNKAGKVFTQTEGFAPQIRTKLPRAVAEPVTVDLSEPTVAGGVFQERGAPTVVEGVGAGLTGTRVINPDVGPLPAGRDIPGALGRTRGVVNIEGAVETPGGIFSFPGEARNVLSAAPEIAPFKMPAPSFPARTVVLGEDSLVRPGGMIFDLPEKASPAWLGAKMRQTGRDYAAASALASALSKRAQKLDNAGIMGVRSISAGALAGFATGSPLSAVLGAVAEKQLERRGGLLAANALRSIADTKVLSGVSKSLSNHIGQILSVAPEVLGAYRYPLSVAAAQGADALMSEYLRLASGPNGQDVMSRVGLPAESAEEVDAAGQRLSVLASMEAAAEAQAVAMDSAIDGLFGSAPGRKASVGPSLSAKEFAKMTAANQDLLANPEKVFEQIPPDMRAAAPAATAEATMTLLNAARYLDSKAPKNPYEGMPPAVAPQWEPSPAELDHFNRFREAVESPARVLKNMSQGYIAPEQVEALKAVYPAMYADLQQKIGERLMMQKKPLSYQQRLALSAVLGPTALGMSPQQVQVLQQSQALAWGQQAGQGKSVKPPDGRQAVDEEQIQTEAQKLEAR